LKHSLFHALEFGIKSINSNGTIENSDFLGINSYSLYIIAATTLNITNCQFRGQTSAIASLLFISQTTNNATLFLVGNTMEDNKVKYVLEIAEGYSYYLYFNNNTLINNTASTLATIGIGSYGYIEANYNILDNPASKYELLLT
jgi:hypothetical protein